MGLPYVARVEGGRGRRLVRSRWTRVSVVIMFLLGVVTLVDVRRVY